MSELELHTQEEFTRLAKDSEWLLLDFWANWCGPCKAMAPVFERVVQQKRNILAAGKVNVDHLRDLAKNFQIRGIPTLVLLRNGEPVEQRVGAQSEKELNDWLEQVINDPSKS